MATNEPVYFLFSVKINV